MKQLKFMLAAATAIGFAAASQADTQIVNQPVDAENFESYTTETPFANLTGFSYDGATAADNESAIIAGGATTGSSFALQVNTGTDPILRKLDTINDLAVNLADGETKKLYIDTKVQFTVTPAGDTVAGGIGDKLMIYLAEATDEAGAVTGTNLVVKAALYQAASGTQGRPGYVPEAFVTNDVKIVNATVLPDAWYRLQVESYVENGVTLFAIKLGETLLESDVSLYGETKTIFPSLLGKASTTLDYVGFAGEGKVDDIAITKDVEQETSVDFTFAITRGDGVSAVAWTIDGVPQESLSASVKAGQTIAITDVTYADWYVASGTYVKDWSTEASEDLTAITVEAKPTANVTTDAEGNVKIEVTENTKPADVGIKTGSFAAADTEPAELNKALTWATTKGGATSASAAGTLVSGLNFTDGEEETAAEKAYLLDCTEAELSGEDGEIAKFKFAGFDPATGAFKVGTEKQVGDKAAYGNGYVEVRGSATVGGAYNEVADKSKHSFFKAFLVPFQPAAVDAE